MEQTEKPKGRPLKFTRVEDLQVKINQYFDDCDKHEDTRKWAHDKIELDDSGKKVCTNCWQPARSRGCMLVDGHLKLPRPYTVTGLALWLDTCRQTLLNYEEDSVFLDTIRAAKQRIENYASEKLFDPKAPTRGVIFSLSNNSDGWLEKKSTTVHLPKDGAAELAKAMMGDQTPANAGEGSEPGTETQDAGADA